MIIKFDVEIERENETVSGVVEVLATMDGFGSFDAELVECEGITPQEARDWMRENACFIHDAACDERDAEKLEREIER